MTLKRIKRVAAVSGMLIGILSAAVYIFAVVGISELAAYHQNAILEGLDWSPSVGREQKLSVLQIHRIISFVLIGCAVVLKAAAFILFRVNRNDKRAAVTLLVVKSVAVTLKFISVFAAIPVLGYLGYTNATMQVQFAANLLFIVAQAVIIVWVGWYLVRLKRENKNLTDSVTIEKTS